MAMVFPLVQDAKNSNGHLVNGANGERLTNGETV